MNRIEEATFIVLDLETASLEDGRPSRICEIGAIKTRDRRELERFQSLVNPQEPITGSAFRIHKISDAMVREAPTFPELADRFREFAKGTILVAHNTAFDQPVLNQELRRAKRPKWQGASIDTIRLARKAFPGLPSYSLDGLASFFEVSFTERHRAIGDCEVTLQVLWKCIDRLIKIDRVRALTDLLELGRNRAAERVA
jgi:DNA polymerase III epsilon subunit family exonuclease